MTAYLAVAFVLLIVAGWLLLQRAGTQREQAGLPEGRVVYTDTGAWNRVEEPLFSRRYLLAGLSACPAQAGRHRQAAAAPVASAPTATSAWPSSLTRP